MATINDRKLVDEIITKNGRYEDDEQIIKIVQYTNAWGGTAYGLIYEGQPVELYRRSEFIRNPITLWELK